MSSKLTEKEFINRISKVPLTVLWRTNLSNFNRPFSERCQEMEFELMLDHRLGTDFPAEKRKQILALFLPFNKSKNSLLTKHKNKEISTVLFKQRMEEVLDKLIADYSQLLSAAELSSFLNVAPNSKGELPFDFQSMRRPNDVK